MQLIITELTSSYFLRKKRSLGKKQELCAAFSIMHPILQRNAKTSKQQQAGDGLPTYLFYDSGPWVSNSWHYCLHLCILFQLISLGGKCE